MGITKGAMETEIEKWEGMNTEITCGLYKGKYKFNCARFLVCLWYRILQANFMRLFRLVSI